MHCPRRTDLFYQGYLLLLDPKRGDDTNGSAIECPACGRDGSLNHCHGGRKWETSSSSRATSFTDLPLGTY